ncbi:MAG: histidine kinase [Caulobacter sp.]|nr:histidine kinase [Caulobacter sp.]
MAALQAHEIEYLQEATARSRSDLRGRRYTFVAIAATFTPLVGWTLALAWFVAVLISSEVVGPALQKRSHAFPTPRHWLAVEAAYLAINQTLIGAIGLAAALRGGLWGVVGAQFLLFCLALLITSTARRSVVYYYAAITPTLAYLVFLACFGFTLTADPGGPIVLLVGTIFLIVHTQQVASANRTTAIKLVQARAEAEASTAEAEASTAAKSAFVAMVSHELRTPISGILAGAEELGRAASDAASRSNAALVTQSARMMRLLLNDLLDLSKLEAGRMDVETIAFDLRQTLLDTLRFWRPEVRRGNLVLKLEGARHIPQWVMGDPTRLRQILNNLFSNALKFTVRGGLILRVGLRDDGSSQAQVVLELCDTGSGMSEEQVGRLFSAFEQLGASTARAHGGTGLGLHISREFARLMGGDLVASSTLGHGSTFRITLPLHAAEPPATAEAPVDDARPRGIRLLVVDDHQVNRQAFALMLQPFCDELVCVPDGEGALTTLAVERFDLVLMDIQMPGIGGVEAIRRLRSTPGPNQGTAVIALTGSASPADAATYAEAGANAMVIKPVEARELLGEIDRVLGEGSAQDDAPPKAVRA